MSHTDGNKLGGIKGKVVGYFQGVVPMLTQVQMAKHSGVQINQAARTHQ